MTDADTEESLKRLAMMGEMLKKLSGKPKTEPVAETQPVEQRLTYDEFAAQVIKNGGAVYTAEDVAAVQRMQGELETITNNLTAAQKQAGLYENRAAYFKDVVGRVLHGAFELIRRTEGAEIARDEIAGYLLGVVNGGDRLAAAKAEVDGHLEQAGKQLVSMVDVQEELERKLIAASASTESMRLALEDKNKDYGALQGRVEELTVGVNEKGKEIQRLTKDYQKLRTDYQTLESQKTALERQIEGLSAAGSSSEEELQTTIAELVAVRKDLQQKTIEMFEIGQELDRNNKEIISYEARVGELTAALGKSAKELTAAAGTIEELRKLESGVRFGTQKDLRDYVIKVVGEDLGSYIGRDALEGIVRMQLAENPQRYGVVGAEDFAALRREFDEITIKYGENVRELDELRGKYAAMERDNKAAGNEAQELREQIEKLEAEKIGLDNAGKVLQERFEAYKRENEAEVERLKSEGADGTAIGGLGTVKAELGVSESKRNGLNMQLKLLYDRLSGLNEQLRRGKGAIDALEEKISYMSEDMSSLVHDRDSALGRAMTAEEHNVELKARLRDGKAKLNYVNMIVQGIQMLESRRYEKAAEYFQAAGHIASTTDAIFYEGLSMALAGKKEGYTMLAHLDAEADSEQLERFAYMLVKHAGNVKEIHAEAAKYLMRLEEREAFEKKKSGRTDIAYLTGLEFVEAGNANSAILAFKRSLDGKDRKIEKLAALAGALEQDGDRREAKKIYETILGLEPENKEAYAKLHPIKAAFGW